MHRIEQTVKASARALVVRLGVLCAAVLSLLAIGNAPARPVADDDTPKAIVLVPPFENQSKQHLNIGYEVAGNNPNQPKKRYTVDRFTEAPRSLFEDMLGELGGITIVERQRVDAILV